MVRQEDAQKAQEGLWMAVSLHNSTSASNEEASEALPSAGYQKQEFPHSPKSYFTLLMQNTTK